MLHGMNSTAPPGAFCVAWPARFVGCVFAIVRSLIFAFMGIQRLLVVSVALVITYWLPDEQEVLASLPL